MKTITAILSFCAILLIAIRTSALDTPRPHSFEGYSYQKGWVELHVVATVPNNPLFEEARDRAREHAKGLVAAVAEAMISDKEPPAVAAHGETLTYKQYYAGHEDAPDLDRLCASTEACLVAVFGDGTEKAFWLGEDRNGRHAYRDAIVFYFTDKGDDNYDFTAHWRYNGNLAGNRAFTRGSSVESADPVREQGDAKQQGDGSDSEAGTRDEKRDTGNSRSQEMERLLERMGKCFDEFMEDDAEYTFEIGVSMPAAGGNLTLSGQTTQARTKAFAGCLTQCF
jgi:hypothetical protein